MDKYIIVRSADLRHLEQLVNQKIGEDYQPIGNLVVSEDSLHPTIYLQTMMRRGEL